MDRAPAPSDGDAARIGRPDQPVRALSFSTGLFDTAMHLGVVHALLVIRGRAPDVVVGISAGAVNAAAVAEILQAGQTVPETGTPEERSVAHRRRREARVARFREIFTEYQQAPTNLIRSLLPDTYQVEARRPLAPIQLPIHAARERCHRSEAVAARAGLINLLNTLLGFRLSLGTMVRLIRRWLGIQAAGDVRGGLARWAARMHEGLHTYNLVGAHLHQVSPLVYPFVVRPLLTRRQPLDQCDKRSRVDHHLKVETHGGTAASIVFQSWWWPSARKAVQWTLGFLLVWYAWLAFGIIALPLSLLLTIVGLAGLKRYAWTANQVGPFGLALGLAKSVGQSLLLLAWWSLPLLAGVVLWRAGSAGLEAEPVTWLVGTRDLAVTLRILLFGSLALLLLAGVALLLLQLTGRLRQAPQWFAERVLASYRLDDSLLNVHPLREVFTRVFDPEFYGSRNMDAVVDTALNPTGAARPGHPVTSEGPPPKTVGGYATREPPVHVGLAVADVATGNMVVVPDGTRVVDGLLAATSLVPIFPPTCLTDGSGHEALYVDGGNVANEPTHPLMTLLRNRVHPEATEVHVYSVSPLPVSAGQVSTTGEPVTYHSLVDVAARAVNLQRLRDAMLERRLTHLYSRVIPAGKTFVKVGGREYCRAWIAPVEPDQALEVTRRYFAQETEEDRQRLIRETVADGCRAALEVMIRDSLPDGSETRLCTMAVRQHAERQGPEVGQTRPDLLDPLAGTAEGDVTPGVGPGIPEVCCHCELRRGHADAAPQTIRIRRWKSVMPSWPVEGVAETPQRPLQQPPFRAASPYNDRTSAALEQYKATADRQAASVPAWPKPRGTSAAAEEADRERPVVSLLFSGGVFRGVYQMGVLNALSELNLRPDIVAGASVGSITAAMVAEAFSYSTPEARRLPVARLAATYLALDKLIMTDRFADFIRVLTIRAAETRFSIREADRFFRRYDVARADRFSAEARRVVAGLERLFYVSPHELHDLVRALRLREARQVTTLLRKYAEEWLDRMEVGNQVLGADPLTLLIREHVLRPLAERTHQAPEEVSFDAFLRQSGIFFLATATNLSQGRLEILGEQQPGGTTGNANLLNGLLASSAFPGVFRPRWSWEVSPGTRLRHQYVDGGVFDNLPLDAVAQFLRQASDAGLVVQRPTQGAAPVPHLLFAASLEANPKRHVPVAPFRRYWPATLKRAKQLGYNRKLELYQETQRRIRQLWQQTGGSASWTPLDLEVVTVIPKWLCGTFAFHPMLGFRRSQQAASIAHGCATTLLELARLGKTDQRGWLAAWGVELEKLPQHPPPSRDDPIVPPKPKHPGDCYWRPDQLCPFSRQAIATLKLADLDNTEEALTEIYRACGRARSHESKEVG